MAYSKESQVALEAVTEAAQLCAAVYSFERLLSPITGFHPLSIRVR